VPQIRASVPLDLTHFTCNFHISFSQCRLPRVKPTWIPYGKQPKVVTMGLGQTSEMLWRLSGSTSQIQPISCLPTHYFSNILRFKCLDTMNSIFLPLPNSLGGEKIATIYIITVAYTQTEIFTSRHFSVVQGGGRFKALAWWDRTKGVPSLPLALTCRTTD